MFDDVAPRYDTTNSVLSLRQDRRWRRLVAQALDVRAGEWVLDLAAGTGMSSDPFVAAGAHVVACDFSLGMLREGRRRHGDGQAHRGTRASGTSSSGTRTADTRTGGTTAVRPGTGEGADLAFVAGDALHLPFADGVFDAATISFGLRNVADVPAALTELRRVTRHGGRLVVCEFSHPTWAPFRAVYSGYLMRMLPRIAGRVSSDPDSYHYLAESIRAWPDQAALAGIIRDAGWDEVAYRNLTGGIVALHRAARP